jgi:Cytochrome c554 and c-prime
LQLDPSHFESRVTLEQVFYINDRLSEADRETKRVLALPGREAVGELLRGQIRYQLSDSAGAVEHFERALLHPEQWDSIGDPNFFRKQLARSLLRTGQPARARESLRRLTDNAAYSKTCWLLSRCDLQESIPVAASGPEVDQSSRQSRPMEPEPAPFVGENQCASCHAGIFRDQTKSRHARTFFRNDPLLAIKVPAQLVADPNNAQVSHAFRKSGQSLEAETRVDVQVYETVIDYAFGSGNRGVSLVGHDQKGEYVECRMSFYPDDVGWDVTPGQTVKPDKDPGLYQGKHLSIDDVRRCVECHHTNAHAVMSGTGAESSVRAIGCERCHGPGGNHLRAVRSLNSASSQDADLAIGRPSLASGRAIVEFCAECHSPTKTGRNLTPDEPDAVRFQGTTLTWSRCYQESGDQLDCVTCHNPHRNAETATGWYESRCLQCHSAIGPAASRVSDAARKAETGGQTSCPVQPETGCIECHMPKTGTPMAHMRDLTDHFIRVHRESKLKTDTPPAR